ncbi:MAG TPA: hypothetical protein GXX19_10820 [Syntrophomonadaceae bacterium]|nr:hypothetical protein [Syntrophomonadaceae bacterium]
MECPRCGVFIVESNPKCWNCGLDTRNKNIVDTRLQSEPFYKTTWFMWLMLLTVYPVGLILMWKYNKHNLFIRVLLTGLIFFSIPLSHIASNQLNHDLMIPYSQSVFDSNAENKIEFKNISIQNAYGVGMVQGEVINHDNKVHSFSFTIGFYDKNKKLLCIAQGTVLNLQPHSSKIFEAISQQYPENAAYQKAQVDALLY